MKKKTPLSHEYIMLQYSDYLLNHGERPKNVFLFAKENKFEEKEFYHYFAGFEQLENEMLKHFFEKSLELVESGTQCVSAKEKLLNVYFVFFENLTMNRSVVLQIVGETKWQHLKVLDGLRIRFSAFVNSLAFPEPEIMKNAGQRMQEMNEKSRLGLLWLHLLSVLEFWKSDTSPDFEKTDLFIEKTIDTGFELLENEPLRKLVDLGKFLWKEKFKVV